MPHRMGRCEFSRLLPNLQIVGLPGACSILVEIGILTTCQFPSDARAALDYRSKVSLSGRTKGVVTACHSGGGSIWWGLWVLFPLALELGTSCH